MEIEKLICLLRGLNCDKQPESQALLIQIAEMVNAYLEPTKTTDSQDSETVAGIEGGESIVSDDKTPAWRYVATVGRGGFSEDTDPETVLTDRERLLKHLIGREEKDRLAFSRNASR